jgi:hypothetical protein
MMPARTWPRAGAGFRRQEDTMSRLHSIERLAKCDVTALDLRAELTEHGGHAYLALDGLSDEALQVVHIPSAGRIGIAWGGDARWADIRDGETIAQLVEMYLSDGDAFEARA